MRFWGRGWGRCIQDLGEMPKRKLDFISEFSVIKCMRYGQMPNNGCINPNEGWLVNLKDQKCLFYISCLFGCLGRRGGTWVGWQRKSYMGLHFYISCWYMGQRGLVTILHFAFVNCNGFKKWKSGKIIVFIPFPSCLKIEYLYHYMYAVQCNENTDIISL